MNSTPAPSLAEFLAAPVEEVVKVAPATVVYGVGGTRRHAVFEGIEPWSDKYVSWARACTISRADMIFRHGVRNLLVIAFTPDNFREADRYREKLFERAMWVIAGAESLADYTRLGWRVRLLGTESVPELSKTAEDLSKFTPAQSPQTLYWSFVKGADDPWQQMLAAVCHAQAKTRAEAIRALYGEDIPPATLYLAFGKPMISPVIIPPLLLGQLQCYWSQRPGYSLTERHLRTILYDYAYVRQTWREEKVERAKDALAHSSAWKKGPILGLGMRLGPFWYPAPMSSPAWSSDLMPDVNGDG
jgi:hypothetical protein